MKKTILIAAVMFFAFSVAAFAQAQFQVGSTPVTTVASCGTTELSGDISFTRASASLNVITGTITISYGVPITNFVPGVPPVPPAQGITITTVLTGGGTATLTTDVSTVADYAAGRLVLAIQPGANSIEAILLNGVRVNIAGNPTLANLTATVTATGNSFLGGQTSVVVISSIASAIASIDAGTPSTAATISALSTNTPNPSGLATVTATVTEGFLNAWNLAAAGVGGQLLQFTPAGIPVGVTLQFPDTFNTVNNSGVTVSTFQRSTSTGGTSLGTDTGLRTSGNLGAVFYRLTTLGSAASTVLEKASVPIIVNVSVTASLPLPQGAATLTVDMAPRAGTSGAPAFPQYTGTTCQRGPLTILTVQAATTNLLMPFAVFTGSGGFDTGLAIANTTKDPVVGATVPQNGTITFNFFPQTGDSFTYTTAAGSPGGGLNSTGQLESGRLYSVLLSQLLTAAGKASTFQFTGYVIAVVNATNAHGQYFVSDFEAFTNGALMLVINPAIRNVAPEGLNN